ncbi:MAG TPA: hypothetical protein VMS02_09175, partial [Solirubrobacteraceae bacterium]|nr:hypothetical protein [Solirubrobacteraceae bacterium]
MATAVAQPQPGPGEADPGARPGHGEPVAAPGRTDRPPHAPSADALPPGTRLSPTLQTLIWAFAPTWLL